MLIEVKKCRHGKGVFATSPIKKGQKIIDFRGRPVASSSLAKESKRGRNILVDPFQVGDDRFILLEGPSLYFNHSCNPNAGFKGKTRLVALRNIPAGNEIFYDYSTVWFEGMKCKCGSPNCRGYIGSFLSLPKGTQKKYFRLGIVPGFIRRKFR